MISVLWRERAEPEGHMKNRRHPNGSKIQGSNVTLIVRERHIFGVTRN